MLDNVDSYIVHQILHSQGGKRAIGHFPHWKIERGPTVAHSQNFGALKI